MSRRDEDVAGLIGRVYEAALDRTKWPDVLIELADAVGGAQVMMGVHDVPAGKPAILAPRMSPEDLGSYRDQWGAGDILWQRTNREPIGQIFHAERLVPREEFVRTPIYNEWHRPLGIGVAGLGVNLFDQDGVPVVCGIKRPAHRDAFSAEETAVFAAVAPHLVRAVEVQRRLEELEIARDAARTIAKADRSGLIVVDARRQVLDTDLAAKRILDAADGLHIEGARLAARDRAASAELDRLLRICAGGEPALLAGGTVRVPRGRGRAPLRIDVAPVSAASHGGDIEWLGLSFPCAILAITDPEGAPAIAKERAMTRFALTPAEADLAVEIAKGDGREAAARRLGISVGTARSHLMKIFEKTGVRRQAELVRLLLGP